ncbi:MAG TPA: 16S rRNA (adenine(1518)-N(6)/adenine(1519)-N(6))-dimethyltransferase RsmA [Candidatus Saccharimonadales bacterium]|nr:16S rRNA (adenine(1518)-N(6)/adenine(1519)-N(6))-dimethyltransferase RsmA [Candidatus Saccharimonadales bacterium]
MADPAPKKSLGQHWLHDQPSLDAMADAASVQVDDFVLEIGPGLGTLTEVLTERAGQVLAVEFDAALAKDLPNRIKAKNLEVVQHDILTFDFTSLPPDYKVVANIPYYLTSNLVRVLSETSNPPSHAVLLVQKEVAQRVAAKPGAMSLLGVTAQFYWQVSLGPLVPAELFTPPPKVDSQILIMQYRTEPLFGDVLPKDFFRLVKAGFSQKRKTLLNSLSAGLQIDKPTVKTLCESVGIDPSRRAQTLSLDEWYNLYISYET